MKNILALFNLFYPALCLCCECYLLDQEKILCIGCRLDLPFVDNADYSSNLLTLVFEGRIPIERGGSFLHYRPHGKTKKLIYELKYKNNQEVGVFLGELFGKKLLESSQFSQIDCAIPVPLHKGKLRKRGYNQVTEFGKKVAAFLGIDYIENLLLRTTSSETQTLKKRGDRFDSLANNFKIGTPATLKNKHILFIDDVVTTGATLEACCKEILKAENVKISIVTIALTE